jgi:hypothetical protein
MAFWKENDMKRFGVLLASAALAASGPAAAMGGLGGGHFGGFGGRSMAMGGFNRGFGFNRGMFAGRSLAAAVANFPEPVFLNSGSTE